MKIIDALRAPWAIRPEVLTSMLEVYDRHARGDKLDIAAIQAAIGKPLDNSAEPYQVIEGVAVLNCIGVMGKRFDLFTQICGGVSTQRLQGELAQALADPNVHSIVLYVDSPGGEVDGTQSLANDLYAARAVKPTVALIDGTGASAAYWAASSMGKVFITGDTAATGSIGVVMAHTDVSKAQDMRGVKTTEITAGKYKRIASNYAPLSQEGRATLQEITDHIYSVFVDAVAQNRNVSTDVVLRDMADGRIFMGKDAVDAGLVDGVTTLAQLIAELNTNAHPAIKGARAPITKKTRSNMDKVNVCGVECETQEAVDATVESALSKASRDGGAEGKVAGFKEGTKLERERITAIQALNIPGHEKLISAAIADGSTPETVALNIVTAEKATRERIATAQAGDAPKPAPHAEPPEAPGTVKEPEPAVVAAKARALVASEKSNGTIITMPDAVHRVRKEMGLKEA